jgi:FkbM family methyltransferase
MSPVAIDEREVRRASWLGLKPAIARLLTHPLINRPVRYAAKFLPVSIGHRLPLNVHSVRYRLDDGSSFELLEPLHDIVARDIHWGGGKATGAAERHKLAALERLSKTVDLFVDVGAYAGICSLIAARSNPHLKVKAYELVPENFLLLVKNIAENDLVGRIDPRLRGLGERHSAIRLPPTLGAASYLTSISLGSTFERGIAIPIVPLDDDLGAVAGQVLIKIDVEGFEDQVLAGARQLVRKCRPDIICEILPGTQQSSDRIHSILGPLGYRWFSFEDHGIEPRERPEPGSFMRDWLFTCRAEL